MEAQLQIESARAQTAEQERSALIQTLVTTRQERAGGMVETRGISQPFTLKGGADQDFGEWTHKVAHVHACKVRRSDSHRSNLGSTTAKDRCQDLRSFVERPLCTLDHRLWRRCRPGGQDQRDRRFHWNALRLPCVFYNRRSQQDCSKCRRRKWLGSLETTAQRVRPDVVHETWRFLSRFRTHRVASELRIWELHWKIGSQRNVNTRRSPTGTDGPARHQTTASWRVDAKEPGGDCHVRQRGRGFPGVVRQTAGLLQHEAVNPNERKQENHKGKMIHVDAPSKGSGKGKSKGKGKKSKSKSKGKGKLNNAESSNWQKGWSEKGDEHADGWTWSGEQADGWWKTTDWQTGTGSGWWTTAND